MRHDEFIRGEGEPVRRCSRCVLPEGFPGAELDGDGVCRSCHRAASSASESRRRDSLCRRFETLVEEHKGRGRFDVLVAYSGGKDSTYTLDLLRRRFGLEVVAVTMDNGFLVEGALDNMRRITDALGVHHMIVRPRMDLQRRLYAEAAERDIFATATLERASSICTACITLVKLSCLRLAIEGGVPMVAYGWTRGQAPLSSALLRPTPEMMRRMQRVLLDPIAPIWGDSLRSLTLDDRQLEDGAALPCLVSPLALYPAAEDEILARIETLGWRRPEALDAHTTNCRLNALANHVHRRRHGYHPYSFELAGLVRAGEMERSEAIARLEEPESEEILAGLWTELGLSPVDEDAVDHTGMPEGGES